MTVSDIANQVLFIVNDRQMVTYRQEDVLSAYNNSLKMISIVRPDASSEITAVTLVAGAKQRLPAEALRLLDSCYQLNDQSNETHALELVNKDDLDRLTPLWQLDPPSNQVTEIMYDERFPTVFWTYPPAQANIVLQLAYTKVPDTADSLDDNFPLSDKYAPAVIEWMLYLLFSRDSENSINQQRAADHRNVFFNVLQVKTQADSSSSVVSQNRNYSEDE